MEPIPSILSTTMGELWTGAMADAGLSLGNDNDAKYANGEKRIFKERTAGAQRFAWHIVYTCIHLGQEDF